MEHILVRVKMGSFPECRFKHASAQDQNAYSIPRIAALPRVDLSMDRKLQ